MPYTYTCTHCTPTSWDTRCPLTCRLSGWLGHSSPSVLPLPLYRQLKRLPCVVNTAVVGTDPRLVMCVTLGHRNTLFPFIPICYPPASAAEAERQFLVGKARKPAEGLLTEGRQSCLGGQASSTPDRATLKAEEASTRRPACCQSWTMQWQRPAVHTVGSCNPW